ncbi:MAG TPA: hypothetical protein ENK18_22955 [Deltaproteobacteria bacterium]|nr:hypothetical protein [Deltaproteobacteria bacterium]
MSEVLNVRLKVRPDVFFVRSEDGVWLRNNVGSFSLRGASAYEIVRVLFSRLDGSRTLTEACEDLGSLDPQAVYRRLVVPLIERGFVREVAEASQLSDELRARFPEHVAFLELYVDDPATTLDRVRHQPIACVGSGQHLRAATVALAELGFADVRLFASEGDPASEVLMVLVEAARHLDGGARWSLHGVPGPFDLEGVIEQAVAERSGTCVVIATDTSAHADVLSRASACASRDGGRAVVIASAGRRVWATPVLSAGGACMECIQRSLPDDGGQPPGPVAISLAAFQAAQRLFCALAGDPVPQDAAITTVDGDTLQIRTHEARRHEGCSIHRARALRWLSSADREHGLEDMDFVRPDISRPDDGDVMVALQDRVVEVVTGWTDPIAGPLYAVGEEDLDQLPLAASRCRIRAGAGDRPRKVIVDCYGYSARETRNQVVLFAIEHLVEGLVQGSAERVKLQGVGAGWSFGEAIYRALARAAIRSGKRPGGVTDRGPLTLTKVPARLGFLHDALVGSGELTVARTELSTGLHRVDLQAAGRHLATGVGVGPQGALEHALLGARLGEVSAGGRGGAVVVYPAPTVERWSQVAVTLLDRIGDDLVLFSLQHFLPFLGSELIVIGVAPGGEHP